MYLCIAILLLFSCTTNTSKQDSTIYHISLKEKIEVNGNLKVELVKIEDSRCPEGAQCFTQGHAKIYLALHTSEEKQSLSFLSTDKMPIKIGKQSFHFIELTPYPIVDHEIKQSDYRIKFNIK